jgi:hypothetical protein
MTCRTVNEGGGRLFVSRARRKSMEQYHEGDEEKGVEELSRQDFLKAAGIAGLGMAGWAL